MNQETKQRVEEVFKEDMKTAEKMDALIDNHDREDISEASIEVAEEILGKIQDPDREKYVYATLFQVGKSVGNEQLVEYAAEKLEVWVEQHG